MVQNVTWFDCDDGTKLYLRNWLPDSPGSGKPRAALQIVHGMAEHGGRYHRLAEKLTDSGIAVWAADQRGHGKTADTTVNDPGKGGLLGHSADSGVFDRVGADMHAINQSIRKDFPGVPLFVLGHSWGSFNTQNYIEKYSGSENIIDGCILSGTRGPDGVRIKAAVPMMNLIALLRGKRKGSTLARALADGSSNRSFRPNRTAADWLSRDTAEVDKYVNDPLCGKLCSSGFYRELAAGLYRIHRPRAMARINTTLPIYIFSGSADPVGDMGASPTALVNEYRSLGIKDLEFVLYPGARHEALNETNRAEVMDNLLSWINRHSGVQAQE
ncbi:MAG TPA: alpha/beta hydrolase [Treponema sp.]|nr:alpha/beta hydrolase [Treponema sp.]